MSDDVTEPVIASRTVWMAALEVARNTNTSLADKVAGVTTQLADFETQPFLALRVKLIRGARRGFEQETAAKLGDDKDVPEAEVEIALTAAELIFLDLSIRVADFKGALTFKKSLWWALTDILGRKQ